MVRESVLITLISTAALGLAPSKAAAKGAMGFAHAGGLSSAASHYAPSFKPVFNPHPGIKDVGYGRNYLQKPAATSGRVGSLCAGSMPQGAGLGSKPDRGLGRSLNRHLDWCDEQSERQVNWAPGWRVA